MPWDAHPQSRHVFGVSSGRAALWLVLKSLRHLQPERSVVAIPAYTCFTVAAAIVRAGLKIYPVDIDPETLDFDYSHLEAAPEASLLCILSSNLFGIVNDVERIRQIARGKGTLFVDDAAQALGATRNGIAAGTSADVGIYSLGRGKALTTIEGGIIITSADDLAEVIRAGTASIPPPTVRHSAWVLFQMLIYSVFLNPRLYWIPNSMPFLRLGVTEFAPDFPVFRLAGFSQSLISDLLEDLDGVNQIRRNNAAALRQAIQGNSHFTTTELARDCQPAYIRFPVIARDREIRDAAVARLRGAGIGAGPLYPSAICDIPGIDPHMAVRDFHRRHAEEISQRLLTLPTHHLVSERDLNRMVRILSSF